MNSYISAVYKIVFLLVLLVVFNYIYKVAFYEKDIQKHSDIINIVRTVVNENPEIVYVGESSNISFREGMDADKRSISSFISDYFPTIKLGNINKNASHAGIYYELLRNIPKNSTIKTVIVTMNLRSFDATWIYSNLETPLQKSLVLIKDHPPLYNRFLLSFRGYDIKTDSEREKQFKKKWKNDVLRFPFPFNYSNVIEWDNAMAKQGIRNSDGSINYPLTELACHYIKTYAFQIDTLTNPRVYDFDKIVLLAKERNWNLVFNLMAENVYKADSLIGNELVYLMKQNRDLLVHRYHRNGVRVVDNLEDIENEQYIDQNWTSEHYAEKGRKQIAKKVAENLKILYPNDFRPVSWQLKMQNEFMNNCEGTIVWGQMQTITSEKSKTGEKSSKTGRNQDYSVTFEYPIKNLRDSLKQVFIGMQLFQNYSSPEIKLVVAISGKKIEYLVNEMPISKLSTTLQEWNEINYIYSLPENFYQGDLIKIFIHNPTPTILFVDDIKIAFN